MKQKLFFYTFLPFAQQAELNYPAHLSLQLLDQNQRTLAINTQSDLLEGKDAILEKTIELLQ